MNQEKIFHLTALGVELMMTRSDVTKGHRDYYQHVAEPLENLLPILRADRVAIIVDNDHFLGLITKIDFLNHLRRNALVTG